MRGPFSRFGRVGFGTERALEAAKLAPFAEQVSRGEAPPPEPVGNIVLLDREQLEMLLMANYRMGNLTTNPFMVGVAPIKLRPAERRTYIFIMNQSTTAGVNLGIGINKPPGDLTAVPADAVLIGPNFGYYEPWVVPVGEIWIAATAANTPGYIVYAA